LELGDGQALAALEAADDRAIRPLAAVARFGKKVERVPHLLKAQDLVVQLCEVIKRQRLDLGARLAATMKVCG